MQDLTSMSRTQRRAVLREFVDAYETEHWVFLARVVAANPDIFPMREKGRTYFDTYYKAAKAELGEAGPDSRATQ